MEKYQHKTKIELYVVYGSSDRNQTSTKKPATNRLSFICLSGKLLQTNSEIVIYSNFCG